MASISKEILFDSITADLNPIKQLILEQLPNPQNDKFSYDNSTLGASDPFFSIEKPTEGTYNLDNLYDWYLTKNPEFKPVNTEGLNILVPEFKFLIAVMAKDLLILQNTHQYPQKHKNNKNNSYTGYNKCDIQSLDLFKKQEADISKSSIVLKLITKFITTNYLYLEFLVILRHYLSLFTIGELYTEGICEAQFEVIDKLMKTPYIIYPTVVQISYAKVIYTTQAPVINFRLSNNRKKLHEPFRAPIMELIHDVGFHAAFTHFWDHPSNWFYNSYNINQYPGINNIIHKLKPFISKTNENTTANTTEAYNNQLLTYIIFQIIHEYYGIGSIVDYRSIMYALNELQEQPFGNGNLFFDDKKLKSAIAYAYNKETTQNLDKTLETLNQSEIIDTSYYDMIKFMNEKKQQTRIEQEKKYRKNIKKNTLITVPLINYIIKTFDNLFRSLSASSPVAQNAHTNTQPQLPTISGFTTEVPFSLSSGGNRSKFKLSHKQRHCLSGKNIKRSKKLLNKKHYKCKQT